jgi:hypothetical protein
MQAALSLTASMTTHKATRCVKVISQSTFAVIFYIHLNGTRLIKLTSITCALFHSSDSHMICVNLLHANRVKMMQKRFSGVFTYDMCLSELLVSRLHLQLVSTKVKFSNKNVTNKTVFSSRLSKICVKPTLSLIICDEFFTCKLTMVFLRASKHIPNYLKLRLWLFPSTSTPLYFFFFRLYNFNN